MPSLRCVEVMGLLDSSDSVLPNTLEIDEEGKQKVVHNPTYSAWKTRDQHVLGFLLKSMSLDVVAQVLDLEHAADVWGDITALYSSQAKAHINVLRGALTNTKKNELSIS